MKVSFWEVFKKNSDGSISPISTIIVGGVTLSSGVSFTKGVTFSGIDFFKYYGLDLEVEGNAAIYVIRGIYPR